MSSRNQGILLILAVIIIGIAGNHYLRGSEVFDPNDVAAAETRMWQAYYGRDRMEIGRQIIALLQNQYDIPLKDARPIGELLAKASMVFSHSRDDYDKKVLPDLIRAYQQIRDASGRSFDPEAAARAELAWWVARRTPGKDSLKQVGEKIAVLYAELYGGKPERYFKAGRTRAEAAHLRDEGGAEADWEAVELLLKDSYRNLAASIME